MKSKLFSAVVSLICVFVAIQNRVLAQEVVPPSGLITGVVLNAATQQPIALASVAIDGAAARVVDSGPDGRFTAPDLPPGSYTLRAMCEGFGPVSKTDVVVTANRPTYVHVELHELPVQTEHVEVTAAYFSRPRDVTTSAYSMAYEEIRRAPGALGDVSRLVQTMPGVAPNDLRNDLVARGGSPIELLTLVDNIEVPNLNHFGAQGGTGGPINMLNVELIRDATFMAGGFPAPYGNRASAVLEVSLREGSREGFEADVEAGFAGAGVVLEGPLGARGSWIVSARRSFLDLIVENVGLTAVPRYSNYQAKAVYDVGPRQRLMFVSLGGMDSIHVKPDVEDTDDPSLLDVDRRGWSTTSGLNWQTLLGDRGFGVLGISHSSRRFETDILDLQIGGQQVFRDRSRESDTTLKYDLNYRVDKLGAVRAGVSGKLLAASFETRQPLGLQSPLSIDPVRVNAVDIDKEVTTGQAAAYVEVSRSLGSGLDVTIGGRYERFALIRAAAVSPRVGLTYHVAPKVDVSASYGHYYQMPPLVFLSALPGNRSLDPIRSDHFVTGLALYPTSGLKVSIEGYAKRYTDYPVSIEFPTLSLANQGEFFDVSGLLLPLTSAGRGYARGIELYVQQKLTRRLYGQVSYAYARTVHRALDGISRPGTWHLPHVLSVIGGYQLTRALEVSTKFAYTSGRPSTPFLKPESIDQNRPIFDLGQLNATRAPAYHRLDFRVDRRFTFGWGSLVPYVEVQNLYNRKNVYQFVWNPKTRQTDTIDQFSRLFLGGFSLKF